MYVWMLLLLALLQLGVGMAAVNQGRAIRRDQERELLYIGRQFIDAIASYHAMSSQQGVSRYPQSLEDLLHDRRSAGVRRHLRKVFVDPMTGQAQWGLIKVGGRIVGVYSLSTRRPIQQSGFGQVFEDGARESYQQWVFQYRPPGAAALP